MNSTIPTSIYEHAELFNEDKQDKEIILHLKMLMKFYEDVKLNKRNMSIELGKEIKQIKKAIKAMNIKKNRERFLETSNFLIGVVNGYTKIGWYNYKISQSN